MANGIKLPGQALDVSDAAEATPVETVEAVTEIAEEAPEDEAQTAAFVPFDETPEAIASAIQRQEWQPYSVWINGAWHSYNRAESLTSPDDLTVDYAEYREDLTAEALIEQARERIAARESGEPSPPQDVPPPEEGAPMGDVDLFDAAGKVARDIGLGIVEAPTQIIGGALAAGNELLGAIDWFAGWLDENVADWTYTDPGTGGFQQAVDLPQLPESLSATGGIIRGISQFMAGFFGGGKLLQLIKPVTKGQQLAKVAVQGAFADATAFDPAEEGLANLLQEHAELNDPVTAFLAIDPDDSEGLNRFKKALEGLGLGIAADGLILGLSAIRAARRAKAAEKALDIRLDKPIEELEVTDRDFLIFGDPNEPLLRVAAGDVRHPDAPEPGPATKLTRAQGEIERFDPSASTLVEGPEGGAQQVFINFARIDGPDDVKDMIGQMADIFAPHIDEARRGVRSHQATQDAADALGMSVEDVLSRRQGRLFNAEEALAARRIWASSAEKLVELARIANGPNAGDIDMFNFRRMMSIHYAIQAEVIGARTETARALNAWAIPAGGGQEKARAIQNLLEASGGPDVSAAMAKRLAALSEQNVHPAALNAVIRKGWAAATVDAVKESFVLGLLWNPATHLVNAGSNLAVAFGQIVERGAARQISRIRGAAEGVVEGEALAMTYGLVTALREALRLAGRSVASGETGLALGKIDLPRRRAIAGEQFGISTETGLGRAIDYIGNTTRVPGLLLGAGDEFFKTIGYRMELHAHALRQATSEGLEGPEIARRMGEIVSNPPENIRIAAADAALYNTFTQKPGGFAQKLMQLRNVGDFNPLFLVLPFLRTPMNILRYSFERTPLAPLVGQWRADILAGGARADIALARIAVGSTIMSVTFSLAYDGVITGSGPKDPAKRAALQRQGWQPNSVWFNGAWHSYNRADPYGMIMGFAADMAELGKTRDLSPEDMDELSELAASVTLAIANQVGNKTYFHGVSKVVEVVSDPDRYQTSYFDRQMASMVPFTSAFAFAERVVDPKQRDANGMVEQVMARMPILSERLSVALDLWGREREPQQVYGRAYDAISPIYVSSFRESPIDAEMVNVGIGVQRIRKSTTIKGVDINFRDFPRAYEAYVRLAGNDLKHPAWGLGAMDYLNAVVTGQHDMSQIYNLGRRDSKASFIKGVITEYRQLAARVILDDPRFADLRAQWDKKRIKKIQDNLPAGVTLPPNAFPSGLPLQ
jgi:hypothetical protein